MIDFQFGQLVMIPFELVAGSGEQDRYHVFNESEVIFQELLQQLELVK